MLTQDELKSFLMYDAKTGLFHWREAKTGQGRGMPRKAGDLAGGLNNRSGYIVIYIGGKAYYAHRLAWLYVYGSWPKNYVDHINENRADNRIMNLRDVPSGTNLLNRSKEGIGVRKRKDRSTWTAYIGVNDRKVILGNFQTENEALAARLAAKKVIGIMKGEKL